VASSSASLLLKNIKLLRERHELTQERVAELSGIDYKFYQSIETGRRPNVTLSTLGQIAVVYGIPGHKLISSRLPRTTVPKTSKARKAEIS
jgi:transcriptional regulator with XRE-family HTH domain